MGARVLIRSLALVALVAGAPGCGGGGSVAAPPPPTSAPITTLPPATLADLSASVTSPQDGKQINCNNSPRARVTLTNGGRGSVTVSGVRDSSRVLGGGCFGGDDATFRPAVETVQGGTTERVLDQDIYISGAGCCSSGSSCDGRYTCRVEETFTVITSVGEVDAGRFAYRISYQDCAPCSALGAAGRGRSTRACRGPAGP